MFRTISGRKSLRSIVGVGLLALIACGDVVEPERVTPTEPLHSTFGQALIECPTNEAASASGTIDARGGVVRLGGHALNVPRVAVLTPTTFRITAPVSNYMVLQIRPEGANSFDFAVAVEITLDYSRCTRSNIEKQPLTVWKIDPDTKELLEPLGGVDDKEARTVTVQVNNLSTFSIAR